LVDAVVFRVNRSSALWQLFAFMGDVITIAADGSARYFEEVPVEYAHENELTEAESFFTITLEYGPDHDQHDPFDVSLQRIQQSDARNADKGRYLHPVVRHFKRGQLIGEHHMAENLENDWARPASHREPLAVFFERQLRGEGRQQQMAVPGCA
jgi:hypothetical protein